ncbi:hypothetical protein B9479_004705 [Cryptococcus floricola]|uniref:non-specific serine/threonine protein kinase n=1 Tax=Cryptococcus floricola TaxID=2591691 RepID=A0A5D3AWN2_9TREE|nr:hypothetical protein B9479_004705 [Cryptococcus floricola]
MATSALPLPHNNASLHQQRSPIAHTHSAYASNPFPPVPTHVPSLPMAQPQTYHQQPAGSDFGPQGHHAHAGGSHGPHAGPSHQPAANNALVSEAGQSTSARPRPPPSSATMPLIPSSALPHDPFASSHQPSHASQSQSQPSRAANRRSHNPGATLSQPLMPRAEELTDEYVLHPSVYSFKQEYPRRSMVGLGPYIVLQTLGEGEFGKVKLGVHADYGVEVAIKLIRRGDLQEEAHASKVEREINVLKTLKHPNIVRMFDVLDTHKYIGIVLEFAGGGELFEYILANEYLKDVEGQRLFAQLISGVDYLHQKGVIHRDLKLENLLLDKHRNLIITDFGFANSFAKEEGDLMSTSCGSPCYAAPELVVLDTPYHGSAVDIWSCGVILFAMVAGYLPYDDDPDNPDAGNVVDLYRYIMNTELHYPEHVSPLGKNLLQHMLILHPEHRIKIPDIMTHPWLKNHRHMFNKSVEECEAAFQEAMYKKSKQARKELQERRRVQMQAKEAMQAREKAFQRSQSSAPGTTITAAALDQGRRRPHSAMPGAPTMPEIIAKHSAPIADAHVPARSATPSSIRAPVPAPPSEAVPIAIDSPRRRSESMAPGLSSTAPAVVSPITAEAQPLSANAPSQDTTLPPTAVAPVQPQVASRPSMRENKNRHTIQVEYDGEASYDKMQEMGSEERRIEGSSADTSEAMLAPPPLPNLKQGDSSDVEMESGSSDNDHNKTPEMVESKKPEAAVVVPTTVPLAPPAETGVSAPSAPSADSQATSTVTTPAEQRSDPLSQAVSPSTPRASTFADKEAVNTTPRGPKGTAAPAPNTPKASLAQEPHRRHGSMPPALSTTVPEPKANPQLNASGLPKPPPAAARKDRSRKGMSLDKFGLSKLLGHASQASSSAQGEGRMAPPSASASAVALQTQLHQHGKQDRPVAETDSVKKSRRRTLQLGFHNRRDSKAPSNIAVPGTPLGDKDPNSDNRMPASAGPRDQTKESRRKTIQLGFNRQNTREIKPLPSAVPVSAPPYTESHRDLDPPQTPRDAIINRDEHPAQSSPSIVTIDPYAAQQTYPNHRGSSSKASKVMDWFRRKTLTKDTIDELRSPGIKSDSQSSFVRVGDAASPQRRNEGSNLAMASYDSVNRTEENVRASSPLVERREPEAGSAEEPEEESTAAAAAPSVTVTPPRPSTSKAPTINSDHQSPLIGRARSASTYTFNETSIRVHTGLVDQSALTTKPPQDVFKEVMQVLRGMGVDMKRESDFKLRCTRAKKRAAGAPPPTGLGSVMSTGSGMNPFSLMNNASSGKTDARGLPLPTSPSFSNRSSAGIKGLLRRGNSKSSAHPARISRGEFDTGTTPSQSTPNLELPELTARPKPEPLYGKELMDAGDEVKFTVELCKMKNLPGLYILKIKRTKGNLWSFKFIYQTVIERTTTLTH